MSVDDSTHAAAEATLTAEFVLRMPAGRGFRFTPEAAADLVGNEVPLRVGRQVYKASVADAECVDGGAAIELRIAPEDAFPLVAVALGGLSIGFNA